MLHATATVHRLDIDDPVPLVRVAALLPGRPHVAAVRRWARRGVRIPTGQRVRLRTLRYGPERVTTCRWLGEFLVQIGGLRALRRLAQGVRHD